MQVVFMATKEKKGKTGETPLPTSLGMQHIKTERGNFMWMDIFFNIGKKIYQKEMGEYTTTGRIKKPPN